MIGKTIGGYVVEGQVGRGGMATVYLARQTSMNRVVALKILPKNFTQDESYYKRFEREVNIVAQLEHRSIVPVYDHGEADGQPYIAMRYMAGGSLDQKLTHGPMRAQDVLDVYAQVAPALDYAHSKNVLHRDLKPSNVLLDETGGAFITDFGIARIIGDHNPGSTITTQGVVGTPSYMSPEQAQGQPLDGRSDLYAMGVMLFELLTARRPFMSDTPYSIAVMQVTAAPPSARAINPNISPAVEQVIFKTLKKKPEERYPTAAELVAALRLAVENPGGAVPHDTQPHRPLSVDTQPVQVTPIQPLMMQQSFTPPRNVSEIMPPPVSASLPAARPVSRRRPGGNLWMSMTIGALIGCGLLAVIGFVIVMVASQLLDRMNATTGNPTPDASVSATGVERAQADTTAPPSTEAAETPEETSADATEGAAVAPIGVRDPMDGRLVFVNEAQRGDDTVSYLQLFTTSLRDPAPTQLTSAAYHHGDPAVSEDGQLIAYVSERTGSGDIYVTDFAGTFNTRILESDVAESSPAWLPDGSGVIFASDTRGDGATSLLLAPVDGSGEAAAVYSESGVRASMPTVSPDGTRVAFVSGAPRDASTWDVVVLDLVSGDTIQLTLNDQRETYPVFSFDGETVYWVSDMDGESSVWRGRSDGTGTPVLMFEGEAYISGLAISPDGSLLLITMGEIEDPVGELYTLPVSGDEEEPEPLDIGFALSADWTP